MSEGEANAEGPSGKSSDDLRADIEATRAQLAQAADALAAKLDEKTQARKKAQQAAERAADEAKKALDAAAERAADAVEAAVQAAPEPVQQAVRRVENVAAPVVEQARGSRRTALVAGAVILAVVIWRLRRGRGR